MFGSLGIIGNAEILPIAISTSKIVTGTTGVVAALKSRLSGTVSYSTLTGTTSGVSIDPDTGVVSIASSLAIDATATLIVRAESDSGDAVEHSFVLKGVPVPVGIEGTPDVAHVGASFSFTPTFIGGSGTKHLSYAGASLAGHGLSFNSSTGAISGTVSGSAGNIVGLITVTDDTGTSRLNISITVQNVPVVLTAPSYTGTLGGVLTLVAGTFGGTGITQVDDWLVDYIPVTGATLDSSLYPGSIIAARSTATNSDGSASAVGASGTVPVPTAQEDNFNSGATAVTSRNWTVNNTSDSTMSGLVVVSSAAMNNNFTHPYSVNQYVYWDTSDTCHAIECKLGTALMPFLAVGRKDSSNYLFIALANVVGGVSQYSFSRCVAGTKSVMGTKAYLAFATPAIGDVVRLELNVGKLHLYINGVEYLPVAFSGTPTVQVAPEGYAGFDVASYIALDSSYTGAGWVPDGRNSVDDVKIYRLGKAFNMLQAADDFPVDGGRIVNLSGVYSGTDPSGIDIGFLDASGAVVMARRAADDFTASGGVWTAQVNVPELFGPSWDNKTIRAQGWNADTDAGDGQTLTTSAFSAVPETVIGMNQGYIYDNTDIYRDLAYTVQWMHAGRDAQGSPYPIAMLDTYPTNSNQQVWWPGAEAADAWDVDWDGAIMNSTASGIYAKLFAPPSDLRLGTYDVVWNPSTGSSTMVIATPTGSSSTGGATAGSVGTNHKTLTFTHGPGSFDIDPYVLIYFSGTLPPEGIRVGENFTIRKQGDTSTLMATDQFISDCSGDTAMCGGPIRWMTPIGTNSQTWPENLTGEMLWNGASQMAGTTMPLAHCIQLCNEVQRGLWWTVPDQCDTTYVEACLNLIKDNLDPSLRLYVEVSNEVWNTGFPQALRYQAQGAALGYWNTNGDAAPFDGGVIECATARGKEPLISPRNVYAAAMLIFTQLPSNGQTVTIGGKVYTFQTTLTNVDGNVKIGLSVGACLTNLANAINASGGTPGTDYATATTAHPTVQQWQAVGNLAVQARSYGRSENAIAVSTTVTNAFWRTPTLVGGALHSEVLSGNYTTGQYLYVTPVGAAPGGATHMTGDRQVVQLTANVGPGDVLDYTTNCSQVVDGGQVAIAGRRAHAMHTKTVMLKVEEVYGENWRDRVDGQLGAWYLDNGSILSGLVNFAGLNGYIRRYLPAIYLAGTSVTAPASFGADILGTGANFAAGALGVGSPAWTSTQRALVNTDKEAFKTAWFAVAPYAVDAWATYIRAMKTSVEVAMRTNVPDYVPDSIEFGSYEGLTWGGLAAYNLTAAYTAWMEIERDSRMGDLTSYALNKLKAYVGGTHCAFMMVGARQTDGAATGRSYSWAIKEYQGQVGDPIGDAFADFFVENPNVPTVTV